MVGQNIAIFSSETLMIFRTLSDLYIFHSFKGLNLATGLAKGYMSLCVSCTYQNILERIVAVRILVSSC